MCGKLLILFHIHCIWRVIARVVHDDVTLWFWPALFQRILENGAQRTLSKITSLPTLPTLNTIWVCQVLIWFYWNGINSAVYLALIFKYKLSEHYTIETLRPRQDARHFADDVFKCIFLNDSVWISLKISLICLFPRLELISFQHWFRLWLGSDQATS